MVLTKITRERWRKIFVTKPVIGSCKNWDLTDRHLRTQFSERADLKDFEVYKSTIDEGDEWDDCYHYCANDYRNKPCPVRLKIFYI